MGTSSGACDSIHTHRTRTHILLPRYNTGTYVLFLKQKPMTFSLISCYILQ